MDEAGSSKGGETLEVRWEIGFTAVAGGLDYMLILLTVENGKAWKDLPLDGIHESLSYHLGCGRV